MVDVDDVDDVDGGLSELHCGLNSYEIDAVKFKDKNVFPIGSGANE